MKPSTARRRKAAPGRKRGAPRVGGKSRKVKAKPGKQAAAAVKALASLSKAAWQKLRAIEHPIFGKPVTRRGKKYLPVMDDQGRVVAHVRKAPGVEKLLRAAPDLEGGKFKPKVRKALALDRIRGFPAEHVSPEYGHATFSRTVWTGDLPMGEADDNHWLGVIFEEVDITAWFRRAIARAPRAMRGARRSWWFLRGVYIDQEGNTQTARSEPVPYLEVVKRNAWWEMLRELLVKAGGAGSALLNGRMFLQQLDIVIEAAV